MHNDAGEPDNTYLKLPNLRVYDTEKGRLWQFKVVTSNPLADHAASGSTSVVSGTLQADPFQSPVSLFLLLWLHSSSQSHAPHAGR